MKPLKFLLVACVIGVLAAQTGFAQPLVEGRHYTRLQVPQPTEAVGKVEVIEFFWYGCPHCADFEPFLKNWLKKLPGDVHFRKVPAILNSHWAPGARLYYTLEAMGLLDTHNDAVFDAMVRQRINLNDEKLLSDWVARQGIDVQKFMAMYKSFAIDSRVRKAAEMTQEYGFGGVPAIVVGGKYLVAPLPPQAVLKVVDGLVEKQRAELKK